MVQSHKRSKLSFRNKLLLNFTIIFALFTVVVLFFQFDRERGYRQRLFEETLDNAAELSHSYYFYREQYGTDALQMVDSLSAIAPDLELRITIIAHDGTVIFDSEVKDAGIMENHLYRPEVEKALQDGSGADIRLSETTGQHYYYYARFYDDVFVRAAAIYDLEVQESLHIEWVFLLYLLALFLVFAIVLVIITRRISETITKLKLFAIRLRSGKDPSEALEFPDDDLGEISSQITSLYRELQMAQRDLRDEQDKLFAHLGALEEGIAFYTPERKKILSNQQFVQNLNLVSGISGVKPEDIFNLPVMEEFTAFIDETLRSKNRIGSGNPPTMSKVIQREKRYFSIRCMFFADSSFEIVIINTTRAEKGKLIRQEMTSNISHELKTPITSILGYLETLHDVEVDEKTRKRFLKRALNQTRRLSLLIGDLASLNKIEEAGNSYAMEKLNLSKLINEVHQNLQQKLQNKRIRVETDLSKKIMVKGNISLLYSIFYNLFDNVIKYGGEDIRVILKNYTEDRRHYYFSFANTGNKVDEVHLGRIFERFYRIDTARSREEGGTGLGLSIVKNAVELHGGTITVKSLPEGGLEFLFSLGK